MPQFDVRTVTCPNCSSINPYGVTVCLKCSTPLVPLLPAPAVSDRGLAFSMADPLPAPNPLPNPMPSVAGQVNSAAQAYYDSQWWFRRLDPSYPRISRGTALFVELFVWFIFGSLFPGVGWLYAGNTTVGVLLLLGSVFWNTFAVILDIFTFGFFLCLHVPANIALIVVSAIALNNYTRRHPELFGT